MLSLAYGCGRLAAALYEPLSMTASLLRDTPDPPPNFVQLRALLGQLQPDQVRDGARKGAVGRGSEGRGRWRGWPRSGGVWRVRAVVRSGRSALTCKELIEHVC